MSSIHVHSERHTRTGICIVWPAHFPGSTDPELHVTALFLGNTDTADFTKEDVLWAMDAQYLWPGLTGVTSVELFGLNKDVPVLTLERTNLLVITRLSLKRNLERIGIQSSSTFDFNPHVTIAKEAEHVQNALFSPEFIHLESPVLWWGNERILHTTHARQERATDAAIAAVSAEHGEWYAGMASAYRHVVSSAVRGALKAAA